MEVLSFFVKERVFFLMIILSDISESQWGGCVDRFMFILGMNGTSCE